MKNYLKAAAGFFVSAIIFSCNDEGKELKEKGYSLFCWPSKTPCNNREYGIEFSYKMIRIEMVNGQLQASEQRVATLICCQYIQELIDTLTDYNNALKNHKAGGQGNLDKRCAIGPDIEVFVNYTVNWQTGKSISFFGFSDRNHPFGFTMYVPEGDHFAAFRDELMKMYKKCCLRESEEEQ
jgi:hypothetical protein